MAKLEVSHRIYARPFVYSLRLDRFIDEYQNKSYNEVVNGDQFDWVTGFYISSTDYSDSSLMAYYDAFAASSYGDHILTAYPPFSAYELEYDILNNNTAIVYFDNLSSFNNAALVALNPAGYYIRELYGDF